MRSTNGSVGTSAFAAAAAGFGLDARRDSAAIFSSTNMISTASNTTASYEMILAAKTKGLQITSGDDLGQFLHTLVDRDEDGFGAVPEGAAQMTGSQRVMRAERVVHTARADCY